MARSFPSHPDAAPVPFDACAYFFPEKNAGGFSRHNTTVQFYVRVNALLRSDMTVLDFGAGRGAGVVDERRPFVRDLRNLRGKVRRVIGVDVDPVVTANPTLDEAFVLPPAGGADLSLPLADESVDLILSDWTFEHIEHPAAMAAEFHRVLRPGGWVCARTPNKWGYIALGARIIPEALHDRVLAYLQPARQKRDVFPTFYSVNSTSEVDNVFPNDQWANFSYTVEGEPAYASNVRMLWKTFLLLSLVTPSLFRPILLVFVRKC